MELFTALIIALIIAFLISFFLKISLGKSIFIAFIAMIGFWLGEILLKGIFTTLFFGLNLLGGVLVFVIVLIIVVFIINGINRNNNL